MQKAYTYRLADNAFFNNACNTYCMSLCSMVYVKKLLQKYLPLLFSLCIIQQQLYAQMPNNYYVHYTTEQGLVGNKIYGINQDALGFIWIFTESGISKFDGKKFVNYTTNNGLPDNDIFNLEQDAIGRTWISCYNKVPAYIYKNKIYTPENDTFLASIAIRDYLRFYKNKQDSSLYIFGASMIYKVNSVGEIQSDTFLKNQGATMIISNGKHRILYNQKIIKVCDNEQVLDTKLAIAPTEKNKILEQVIFHSDTIICISKDEFIIYAIEDSKLVYKYRGSLPGTNESFYQLNNQLWKLSLEGGAIPLNFHFEVDSNRSIIGQHCLMPRLFIDREGNYWVTSSNNGVYVYLNQAIGWYTTESGLLKNEITSCSTSDNEVLLQYGTNKIQYLQKDKLRNSNIQNQFPPDVKIKYTIENKSYFVSTTENKIHIYDKNTGKSIIKNDVTVKAINWGKNESILLGSYSSAIRISLRDGSILNRYFDKRTVAIAEDDNETIWMGTIHGVYTCKTYDSVATYYTKIPELTRCRISDIKTYNNLVCIATVQDGLFVLYKDTFMHINQVSGLSNNHCIAVLISSYKQLWVATNSGITKLEIDTSKCRVTNVERIDERNILLSNQISALCVMNKVLYAATSKGLLAMPLDYRAHSIAPSVVCNYIRLNDSLIDDTELSEVQVVYPLQDLVIDFSCISFLSKGNTRIRYRLVGQNNEWIETTEHELRWENLPPGKYILEVKGIDAFGTTSNNVIKKIIHVQPRWWQTWTARLGLLVFVVLATVVMVQYILNRKHKKAIRAEQLKMKMAELELKAIKAQINPHFLFNSLNAIQYFIHSGLQDKADEYLTRLAKLIRNTLELSNLVTVPLEVEIAFIKNYLELESLRFDDDFSYSIVTNECINTSSINIPPLVLQPHIENAIRHGLKPAKWNKYLHISFNVESSYLICCIDDNGVGMNHSVRNKTHTSIGVELSQSKLDVYCALQNKKGSIDIIEKQDMKGICVIIKIEL